MSLSILSRFAEIRGTVVQLKNGEMVSHSKNIHIYSLSLSLKLSSSFISLWHFFNPTSSLAISLFLWHNISALRKVSTDFKSYRMAETNAE